MFEHYTEEMRMMSFNEIIRDIIDSRLDRHIGETVRISNLPELLIEEDDAQGKLFIDENDARSFIENHPAEEEATIRNFMSERSLVKQNDPGYFTYLMEIYGIEKLFDSADFMHDFDQEEITLTPDIISWIREDLGIETEQERQISVLYGYVYDEGGMHGDPIKFQNDPEEISLFIMNNFSSKTMITNDMDEPVFSSLPGGFLDEAADETIREEILEHLLPYQEGKKYPIQFPVEESYIKVGDNTVQIQFNSDHDFDYTIYDRDFRELDGGIIDNTHRLDSIPGFLSEDIRRMHDLGGEIEISDIHILQHEEAIYRMEALRLKEGLIDDFSNSILWQSTHEGDLYHLSEDQDWKVFQFEETNGCIVYYVVHDDYFLINGIQMEMENYLYVSDSIGEWNEDRQLLKKGMIHSYVNCISYPELSGTKQIGVAPRDGGLIRNDRGYDFSVMSARDLADKIDQYNLHHDPMLYVESEYYQGKGFDETISAVRHNDFEKIVDDLRAEINSNGPISEEAKEILSDIDAYSKDYDMHLDNGMDLKGGMSL